MSLMNYSIRIFGLMSAAAIWWLAGLYLYLSPKLPEASALTDIKLQTPLRIVSSDGQLIGQFGEQKRIPARYVFPTPFHGGGTFRGMACYPMDRVS